MSLQHQCAIWIKHVRKKVGLTQVEMSKSLEISQGTLSKLEKGYLEPRLTVLCKIRDLYGLNIFEKLELE